jgi:sugar phosphate isomerase/epimerase
MTTRRQFLSKLALTAAVGSRLLAADPSETASTGWPIAIFEKVFEALSYDELADAMVQIGADGVEATIRPGGHIEPAVAADEVPKMAQVMSDRGKRIVIAATHIRSVDEPHTESLLKTLKSTGVTHYRMGHYYLDLNKPVMKQVEQFAAQARDLAALNRELGIQGLYQNHSGTNRGRGFLGALGWDAAFMLKGIDPDALGLAFDTRHLRKDTGSSWQTAVAVCKPHIRSIYVKDGVWRGERGDEYHDVPLDTGFVNESIFNHIRNGLEPMPLCIHMEWLSYRVFKKNEIPEAIAAHQRDIAALRRWMEA